MATSKNEAGRKGGLASAKAKLAKVAAKRAAPPMMFKGQVLTITNRLYAIVYESDGRLIYQQCGKDFPCIYGTRKAAREAAAHGARVIRLNDITGIVQ